LAPTVPGFPDSNVTGSITRFRSPAAFAVYNGTAPARNSTGGRVDAAHRSTMPRGRNQRLPRRRAVANPQPHLTHPPSEGRRAAYTGIERFAEPRGVHVPGLTAAG
jgi:hypothetical protein